MMKGGMQMRRVLIVTVTALTMAIAQDAPPTKPATGSISGIVKDEGTGTPMPEVQISVNSAKVEATTDSQGHYTLRGLAPGTYRVAAHGQHDGTARFGPSGVKHVTLAAGQDLASIDFQLQTFGQISGKFSTRKGAEMAYDFSGRERVPPGRIAIRVCRHGGDRRSGRISLECASRAVRISWLEKRVRKLDAISNVPADPKLRKRVPAPTYYPDSTSLDGGQSVTLLAGEHREGMDIRMARSASYCMEGTLEANGGPAGLFFQIHQQQPTSGRSGGGGFYTASPNGTSGPDGKIRICDLHPGDYQLTAAQFSEADESVPFFGTTTFSVSDRDVRGVKVGARPRLAVPGEVVWYGTPPEQPVQSKISCFVDPLTRAPWGNETNKGDVKSSIPGEFSFPGLLLDDYELSVHGIPHNLYLKDITYGGLSILHEPLGVGRAMGNATLRVIVAPNGGYVSAKVADKDGNPVPDSYVIIVPSSANSESALATNLISGQTDQNGVYSSDMLAPGKYLTLASSAPVDSTPESIGKLLRSRSHAQEVEIAANMTAQVTLPPVALE